MIIRSAFPAERLALIELQRRASLANPGDRDARGVGRALVDACGSRAAADGSRLLHVIGNPHADGFYRRIGFEPTEPVQTEFGPASRYVLALR
jgi:predicted N-acetyltransferase YhbS